jgi:hypothetical protein
MALWMAWFSSVCHLRGACSRTRTFVWVSLALAGFCIRTDLAGVSSWVRALALRPTTYQRLLHLCHCPALDL